MVAVAFGSARGLELNPLRWANVQKITTAMFANNVPPRARVLELSQKVDARSISLYTTPRQIMLCAITPTSESDMALLQVAATRAQVVVEVRDWRGAATLADLSERFDAVVCHDFLCALDEKTSGEALAAAGAALRPGGRLVWVEPDQESCRISALIQKEWKRVMPRAIINTDAEDGLDLGVATRPPEPVTRRDGQPRGDASKGKGKGFASPK